MMKLRVFLPYDSNVGLIFLNRSSCIRLETMKGTLHLTFGTYVRCLTKFTSGLEHIKYD